MNQKWWFRFEMRKNKTENSIILTTNVFIDMFSLWLYRIILVHFTSNNRFNRFKLPFILLFYGFCVLRSIKYTEIWTLNAERLNFKWISWFRRNYFRGFQISDPNNMQFPNKISFETDCHLRCRDCVSLRFFMPQVTEFDWISILILYFCYESTTFSFFGYELKPFHRDNCHLCLSVKKENAFDATLT